MISVHGRRDIAKSWVLGEGPVLEDRFVKCNKSDLLLTGFKYRLGQFIPVKVNYK